MKITPFILTLIFACFANAQEEIISLKEIRKGKFLAAEELIDDPFIKDISFTEASKMITELDKLCLLVNLHGSTKQLELVEEMREEFREDVEYNHKLSWKLYHSLFRDGKRPKSIWTGETLRKKWLESSWGGNSFELRNDNKIGLADISMVSNRGVKANGIIYPLKDLSLQVLYFLGYNYSMGIKEDKILPTPKKIKRKPIKKKSVISDIDAKVVKESYGFSDVSWKCKLTNRGSYSKKFTVEFTIYDKKDFKLDSDTKYDVIVPAKKTITVSNIFLIETPIWRRMHDMGIVIEEDKY